MSCQVINKTDTSSSDGPHREAVEEAARCLTTSGCGDCELCRYFCPDLCITRNPQTHLIEIDYNYCKGCGICAFICPKGAITMERS